MAKKTNKQEIFSYEEALEELQAILHRMESGATRVDDLAQDIEKAMQLLQRCKERLYQVEKKVEETIAEKAS